MSTLTFIGRGTFADDPAKAPAEAEASEEYSDHEDWIDGVEVILSHMELADNPPALGLNQAQLLLG